MARLDRLGPAKEVAQIGAAIGREFSHALLAAVTHKAEVELQSALDRLMAAGLLFRQGQPPHATYLFKHALTARYKAAYGGRGSGKSHLFGEMMVEECLLVPGTLAVCIREVQKSLMQSSKRLIAKIHGLGVGDQFKVLHDRIITPGDGLIIFQGMQDATAERSPEGGERVLATSQH
jgi:Phage terminase large subunit